MSLRIAMNPNGGADNMRRVNNSCKSFVEMTDSGTHSFLPAFSFQSLYCHQQQRNSGRGNVGDSACLTEV
jgi:hypothetical protein